MAVRVAKLIRSYRPTARRQPAAGGARQRDGRDLDRLQEVASGEDGRPLRLRTPTIRCDRPTVQGSPAFAPAQCPRAGCRLILPQRTSGVMLKTTRARASNWSRTSFQNAVFKLSLTHVGAPPSSDDPAACVADKGYHSRAVLTDLDGGPWKTRIAEPQRRGVARWHGDTDARRAVYNNRTRLRSGVGKQAMRQRAELVERSFAHILDRGGMRRTWLRGRENVHKRYLIHVAGHNLGLLMRLLIGAGTPKEAVASGWCFLVLLPTGNGAYEALIMILVAHSAMPALIVFRMGLDHRPG